MKKQTKLAQKKELYTKIINEIKKADKVAILDIIGILETIKLEFYQEMTEDK